MYTLEPFGIQGNPGRTHTILKDGRKRGAIYNWHPTESTRCYALLLTEDGEIMSDGYGWTPEEALQNAQD